MNRWYQFLIVFVVVTLSLMLFITGAGLILIDIYEKPRPPEKQVIVMPTIEHEAIVEVATRETAVVSPTAERSFNQLNYSDGGSLTFHKPHFMSGHVLRNSEITGFLASYNSFIEVQSAPSALEAPLTLSSNQTASTILLPVAQSTQIATARQLTTPTVEPTSLSPAIQSTETPTAEQVVIAAVGPTAEPPTPLPTETPIPPATAAFDNIYVVRYGDSISRIATQLGISTAILMEVNGLTLQSVIHPGDQLQIPDITHLDVPQVGALVWPVESRPIIKRYQYGHRAIDIVIPNGSAVVATAAGTVEYAGWNQHGYGYMVLIDHGNDVHSLYAHLSDFHVKSGDVVEQGQLIADSGSTGNSTMPHLHLEIRIGFQLVNPCLYLPDGC